MDEILVWLFFVYWRQAHYFYFRRLLPVWKAKSRNANILAEIIGYGASSDAHHITQPSIGGEGAARAMNIAINNASINYSDVNYVNAHGTSTPLNDKFETMSMKTVFKEKAPDIPISSTKSMTGHLLGAAGSVESIFSIMSLNHNILPATLNLNNPIETTNINLVSKESIKKNISYALSNSFGFGGTNTALLFKSF